jgi:ABC-type dipeptide/oligopeptide/nickel transport system permease component
MNKETVVLYTIAIAAGVARAIALNNIIDGVVTGLAVLGLIVFTYHIADTVNEELRTYYTKER